MAGGHAWPGVHALGHAWQGGMCMAWGACMMEGMHGWGHVRLEGVCMARGHVWQGVMCGCGACMAGGHVWSGGMYGWEGCRWRGGHVWQGICMAVGHVWQGGMHARGCACQGGMCDKSGGAFMARDTATVAGGMHPTGMHSCYKCSYMAKFLFLQLTHGVSNRINKLCSTKCQELFFSLKHFHVML